MCGRISFRRFVGLSLSDAEPDHSTRSRFRSKLGDRYDRLLSRLNGQFESRGLWVRAKIKGTGNKKRDKKTIQAPGKNPNITASPHPATYAKVSLLRGRFSFKFDFLPLIA